MFAWKEVPIQTKVAPCLNQLQITILQNVGNMPPEVKLHQRFQPFR